MDGRVRGSKGSESVRVSMVSKANRTTHQTRPICVSRSSYPRTGHVRPNGGSGKGEQTARGEGVGGRMDDRFEGRERKPCK